MAIVKPIEVLLAEDSENDIVIFQDVFSNIKLIHLLHIVKDGEEALRYLWKESPFENSETPRLIIMDINMPKINGFQVLEEIKKDDNLKRIPVVMLTTSDRDDDVTIAYEKGACSYLTKPMGSEALQATLEMFAAYWTQVSRIPVSP